MRERVLIKGAGDLASAVAHRLFRCGYRVVLTELAQPAAVRRSVAFSSAILHGRCEVEGVTARRYGPGELARLASCDFDHIPIFVDPGCELRRSWRPDVLIDARMLKREAETRIDDAPLVIGLGPGFCAGRDVHFAIETQRGHDLGRIIAEGSAAADTGTPGAVRGYTTERVLRAPATGALRTQREIGELVAAGEQLGTVDDRALIAPIAGVLRGLLYDGAPVTAGQKIGDIDPRGARAACYTLSDKARTISGAALELVVAFGSGR